LAPVASVDELGAGATTWSVTVKGDPAFRAGTLQEPLGTNTASFVACSADSPQVGLVECTPPAGAMPGVTFDAIATVHADDGSFADGTVKLHAEVTAPVLTVDKTNVDFGDVAPGENATIPLRFTADDVNGDRVDLVLDPPPKAKGLVDGVASYFYGPFVITPGDAQGSDSFMLDIPVWNVTFMADVPGEYSATVGWLGRPSPGACTNPVRCPGALDPTPCDWTTTITLHARVVGDGGTDADIADASDGGADGAPDAP
jgi:hypothetical protein